MKKLYKVRVTLVMEMMVEALEGHQAQAIALENAYQEAALRVGGSGKADVAEEVTSRDQLPWDWSVDRKPYRENREYTVEQLLS